MGIKWFVFSDSFIDVAKEHEIGLTCSYTSGLKLYLVNYVTSS